MAGTVNRATLDFVSSEAATGDHHRMLSSAAANLGEYGATLAVCRGLLTEAGRDSGLAPVEVDRQIACGIEYGTPEPTTRAILETFADDGVEINNVTPDAGEDGDHNEHANPYADGGLVRPVARRHAARRAARTLPGGLGGR